jgi:hypothetical protein
MNDEGKTGSEEERKKQKIRREEKTICVNQCNLWTSIFLPRTNTDGMKESEKVSG